MMNPPKFLASQVGKDPHKFIDEVKYIFWVMLVTCSDRWDWHPTNSRMWLTYDSLSGKTIDMTLSFVTPYISVQFNVSTETLWEPFSVLTLVGDQVISRRVYRNCPVTVSQKVTSADLVELEMVDFDVILGMDWLHSCYASVDYRTRIVHFQFQDESILEWRGSRLAPMGRFISYLTARKMISKVIYII